MLLAAENILLKDGIEKREILLARRRASNYRKMRELLQNPQNHHLDSTLSALTIAGSAELRQGNVAAGKSHLSAILTLMRQRRGLRTLQSMTSMTGTAVTHVLHMTGIPMLFDTQVALQQSLRYYEVTLQSFDLWNHACRREIILKGESLTPRYIQSQVNFSHLRPDEVSTNPHYWSIRTKTVGSSSAIGQFLAPQSTPISCSGQRCRAGSLYCLNSILYNLRDNETVALNFIVDLDYTLRNSVHSESSPGADGDMLSANKHAAFVSMITYCARKHGIWDDHDLTRDPALRVWESLEFLELMALASPDKRKSVMGVLYSWLTCDGSEADSLPKLDLSELARMKCEIMRYWIALNNPD